MHSGCSHAQLFRFDDHELLSMATEHILYLARSDSDEEHVLVNVSSAGPSLLDLKLLATEGESPYIATSKLRCHTSRISTDH